METTTEKPSRAQEFLIWAAEHAGCAFRDASGGPVRMMSPAFKTSPGGTRVTAAMVPFARDAQGGDFGTVATVGSVGELRKNGIRHVCAKSPPNEADRLLDWCKRHELCRFTYPIDRTGHPEGRPGSLLRIVSHSYTHDGGNAISASVALGDSRGTSFAVTSLADLAAMEVGHVCRVAWQAGQVRRGDIRQTARSPIESVDDGYRGVAFQVVERLAHDGHGYDWKVQIVGPADSPFVRGTYGVREAWGAELLDVEEGDELRRAAFPMKTITPKVSSPDRFDYAAAAAAMAKTVNRAMDKAMLDILQDAAGVSAPRLKLGDLVSIDKAGKAVNGHADGKVTAGRALGRDGDHLWVSIDGGAYKFEASKSLSLDGLPEYEPNPKPLAHPLDAGTFSNLLPDALPLTAASLTKAMSEMERIVARDIQKAKTMAELWFGSPIQLPKFLAPSLPPVMPAIPAEYRYEPMMDVAHPNCRSIVAPIDADWDGRNLTDSEIHAEMVRLDCERSAPELFPEWSRAPRSQAQNVSAGLGVWGTRGDEKKRREPEPYPHVSDEDLLPDAQ